MCVRVCVCLITDQGIYIMYIITILLHMFHYIKSLPLALFLMDFVARKIKNKTNTHLRTD